MEKDLFRPEKGLGPQEEAQNYYYVCRAEVQRLYPADNLLKLKEKVIVKRYFPLSLPPELDSIFVKIHQRLKLLLFKDIFNLGEEIYFTETDP